MVLIACGILLKSKAFFMIKIKEHKVFYLTETFLQISYFKKFKIKIKNMLIIKDKFSNI